MAIPAEKRQKLEEAKAAETKEAPEPPKEHEVDCGKIKDDKKNTEPISFLPADTSLNVLPSTHKGVFMSMNEGCIQNLMAGVRGNLGLTKGRYMFEARAVEQVSAGQRHTLRVGFSTQGSDLVLGSTAAGIAFDSEGGLFSDGKRAPTGGCRFGVDCVVSVVLNLDAASPNANTISLFKDGQRMTQPVPLPEDLKGKALFPHVSFRGLTVFTNFGPAPLAPLPFKCHMLQECAKSHVKVVQPETQGGKCDVVFPVGLPDEGTFLWLDLFKEKYPSHVELSERSMLDWAVKSGAARSARGASNDRAESKDLDMKSLRKAVFSVVPLQPRNYIVMEVRGNLLEDERSVMLKAFDGPAFTKKAIVAMGEPAQDFRRKTQEIMLQKKQDQSDRVFKAKQAEEKRLKLLEKKKQEAEKKRQKAVKEAKKKAKELQKKVLAEKKAKLAAEGKDPEDEKKEESEAEEESDVEEVEQPEDIEVDEEPPTVELTAEEKKVPFPTLDTKDLTIGALSGAFGKFSLPTTAEGFNDVQYAWSKSVQCQDHLKKWISERKLSLRVEDLQPGQWSSKTFQSFGQAVSAWQRATKAYKDKVQQKAMAKAAKEAKVAAAKAAKEMKEKREAVLKAAKEKQMELARAAGKVVEEEKKEEKEEEAKEEEEETKMEVESEGEQEPDFAEVDIYGLEDVTDVGAKVPLFKEFTPADWAMLALRFELHLLAHAFKKDVNDAERIGFKVDNLPFYYQKYFKKALVPKDYGVDNCEQLCKLVRDTVFLTPQGVLQSQLAEEWETFAVFGKITEDARRNRLVRIDAGEEAAKLNLQQRVLQVFKGAESKPLQAAKGEGKQGQKRKEAGWNAWGDASSWWGAAKGGAKGGFKGAKGEGKQQQQQVQKPKAVVAATAVAGAAPAKAAGKGVAAGVTAPKGGIVRPGGVAVTAPTMPKAALAPTVSKPAGVARPGVAKPAGATMPGVAKPAGATMLGVAKPAGAMMPGVAKPAGAMMPGAAKPAGAAAAVPGVKACGAFAAPKAAFAGAVGGKGPGNMGSPAAAAAPALGGMAQSQPAWQQGKGQMAPAAQQNAWSSPQPQQQQQSGWQQSTGSSFGKAQDNKGPGKGAEPYGKGGSDFSACGKGGKDFSGGGKGGCDFSACGKGGKDFSAGGKGGSDFSACAKGGKDFSACAKGGKDFSGGGMGGGDFAACGKGGKDFSAGGKGGKDFSAGGKDFSAGGKGGNSWGGKDSGKDQSWGSGGKAGGKSWGGKW